MDQLSSAAIAAMAAKRRRENNRRQHMGVRVHFNGGTISTKNAAKSKSQLIFGGPERTAACPLNQCLSKKWDTQSIHGGIRLFALSVPPTDRTLRVEKLIQGSIAAMTGAIGGKADMSLCAAHVRF